MKIKKEFLVNSFLIKLKKIKIILINEFLINLDLNKKVFLKKLF